MVVGGTNSAASVRYGLADLANGIPQFYAPGFQVTSAEGDTSFWNANLASQFKSATGTSCGNFNSITLTLINRLLIMRSCCDDCGTVGLLYETPTARTASEHGWYSGA